MNFVLNERVKCSECPVRHRAVCARCDDSELSTLEGMKSYRSYTAGETILWGGDELHFVSSVVKGVATLSRTMEDGRTQLVGLLLPSDFIGRPEREVVVFDVIAITDVTLCCFERKPFAKMVEETPHISRRLMEMALDELDAARDWMLLLGRKTAREKIATFIEMLVRRTHVQGVGGVQPALALPLTRDEIANYVGLTLETVSRQLSSLKRDGVIRFSDRRHFEVLDMAKLQDASGDDADGGVF